MALCCFSNKKRKNPVESIVPTEPPVKPPNLQSIRDDIVPLNNHSPVEPPSPRPSLKRSWTEKRETAKSQDSPTGSENSGKLTLRLNLGELPRDCDELDEAAIKRAKIERSHRRISKISENIYLGSEYQACSLEALQNHNITHILNCAGLECPNSFPDDFKYLSLFLRDHAMEQIVWEMYLGMEFIEQAIAGGGRILVHCSQGVSRSTTMVIGYLMWKNTLTFDAAFDLVKARHPVASPNPGFIFHLLEFEKRVVKRSSRPLFCFSVTLMSIPKGVEQGLDSATVFEQRFKVASLTEQDTEQVVKGKTKPVKNSCTLVITQTATNVVLGQWHDREELERCREFCDVFVKRAAMFEHWGTELQVLTTAEVSSQLAAKPSSGTMPKSPEKTVTYHFS